MSTVEEHRIFIAKLFAVAARNGVEDLHAEGVFDGDQAPIFNRLMRARIYEALVALASETEAASDWVIETSDLDVDDPLLGALPPASERAVYEFARSIGLSAEQRSQLTEAARVGIFEAIDVHNRAADGDDDAQRMLGFLVAMVPDYWEDPEVDPEIMARLGLDTS